jgi:4-hydroxy-tetrahydrodipicolinate reductase
MQAMIRLAQLYTGGVGSEIVRRLDGHPQLELVAVLVHTDSKARRDSGELVGGRPNGIITTQSVEEVIAAGPDAAIYSGPLWDVPLMGRLLRAGINVYTGMGGYFLPGQPEFEQIDTAAKEGNASFTAGGNIPGLISDVFPLFVSGYTGRIRYIRAWQRNHVSTNPSAAQIQSIGLGVPVADEQRQTMIDNAWVWCLRQSANMIAAAIGFECTNAVLTRKDFAVAEEDVSLEGSGLIVKKGTVAGARWSVTGYAGERPFVTITNEQTAVLGLGEGWRENHLQPAYTVEIDGDPPITATMGWPEGTSPGAANYNLNAARAMNTIIRLVSAPPGAVSVLDFPMVAAGDGLAPEQVAAAIKQPAERATSAQAKQAEERIVTW